MAMTTIISVKYSDFDVFLPVFRNYLETNSERLVITTELIAELTVAAAAWTAGYTNYINVNSRTLTHIRTMKDVYKEADRLVRFIQQGLKNSISVILTEDDRTALNIPERKKPSPIPVPTLAPSLKVVNNEPLMVEIEAQVARTSELSSAGMPAGVQFIGMKVYLGGRGRVPNPEKYYNLLPQKRARFKLSFKAEERGKEAHLFAWYQNGKGKGPDSKELIFYIT